MGIISRLTRLEQQIKPKGGVFILSSRDGGGVELLQAGVRQFFKSEVEAFAHIPTDATCIIDDL